MGMRDLFKSSLFRGFMLLIGTTIPISFTVRANGSYGFIDGLIGDLVIMLSIATFTVLFADLSAKIDSPILFVNHLGRWVTRFVVLSFFPTILSLQSGNYGNLSLALYSYTIFYIAFELYYNYYRNDPPFYVGKTAIHDKVIRWINTNSLMMSLYPAWYFIYKLLLHVAALACLIKYYFPDGYQ